MKNTLRTVRLALIALAILLVAGVGGAFLMRGQALTSAEKSAGDQAQALALAALPRVLLPTDTTAPVSSTRQKTIADSLTLAGTPYDGVTLWSDDGTVLFSIDKARIGTKVAERADLLKGVLLSGTRSEVYNGAFATFVAIRIHDAPGIVAEIDRPLGPLAAASSLWTILMFVCAGLLAPALFSVWRVGRAAASAAANMAFRPSVGLGQISQAAVGDPRVSQAGPRSDEPIYAHPDFRAEAEARVAAEGRAKTAEEQSRQLQDQYRRTLEELQVAQKRLQELSSRPVSADPEFEQRLLKAEGRVRLLESQLQAMGGERDRMAAQVADLKSRAAEKQKPDPAADQRAKQFEQEGIALRAELEGTKTELEVAKRELAAKQDRGIELERELEAVRPFSDEVGRLQAELEVLRERAGKVPQLEVEVDAYRADRDRANTLQREVVELKANLAVAQEAGTELDAIRAGHAEAEQTLGSTLTELTSTRSQLSAALSELETAKIEVDALRADRDRAESLDQTLARLREELDASNAQHAEEIQTSVAKHAEDLRTAKAHHDDALRVLEEQHAAELDTAHGGSAQERDRLLAAHTTELDSLREGHARELDALRDAYTHELDAATAALDGNAASARAALETELGSLRAELANARTELEDVRARHEDDLRSAKGHHDETIRTMESRQAAELEAARTGSTAETDALLASHAAELESARASHAAELEALGIRHSAEIDTVRARSAEAIAGKDTEAEQLVAAARAELQAELESIESQLQSRFTQRLAQVTSEAEEARARAEAAHEAALTEAEAARLDAERARAQAEQVGMESTSARTELDAVRGEMVNVQDELASTRDRLAEAIAEAEAATGADGSLRSELEASRSGLASAQNELDATRTELDALKHGLQSAKGEAEATAGEVAALRAELQASQARLVVADRELEDAQTTFGSTRTELESALAEVTSLREQMDAASRDLAGSAGDIAATRGELEAAREDHAASKRDLAAAQAELETVAAQLQVADQQMDRAAGELETARQEVAQLADQAAGGDTALAALQQELRSAQDELARALADTQSTSGELESLRVELEAAQAEIQTELTRGVELVGRAEKAEHEVASLREQQLAQVNGDQDALQREIQSVAEQLAAVEARLQAAEQDRDDALARAQEIEARAGEIATVATDATDVSAPTDPLDDRRGSTQFMKELSLDAKKTLTQILGLTLTLKHKKQPNEQAPLLRQLAAFARRLDHTVSDLADADKLARGTIELTIKRTNLEALVQRVVEESGIGSDHDVRVETEELIVGVDPLRTEQILNGLLRSAADRTPLGAQITVRLVHAENGAMLSVEDKEPSSDASLSPVVQRLADIQGGWAKVESRQNGGSAFRVFLPDRSQGSRGPNGSLEAPVPTSTERGADGAPANPDRLEIVVEGAGPQASDTTDIADDDPWAAGQLLVEQLRGMSRGEKP